MPPIAPSSFCWTKNRPGFFFSSIPPQSPLSLSLGRYRAGMKKENEESCFSISLSSFLSLSLSLSLSTHCSLFIPKSRCTISFLTYFPLPPEESFYSFLLLGEGRLVAIKPRVFKNFLSCSCLRLISLCHRGGPTVTPDARSRCDA